MVEDEEKNEHAYVNGPFAAGGISRGIRGSIAGTALQIIGKRHGTTVVSERKKLSATLIAQVGTSVAGKADNGRGGQSLQIWIPKALLAGPDGNALKAL